MTNNGIVDKLSHHSVDETLAKLQAILQAKGIAVFALVDHSGEAAKVGMKMRPTKLLIFGNPKGGTPLMLAAPSIAIDLPLKILIWEDDQGKSLGLLQQHRIFSRAASSALPFNGEYRYHRDPGGQYRRVTLECGFMPESTVHDQIVALRAGRRFFHGRHRPGPPARGAGRTLL